MQDDRDDREVDLPTADLVAAADTIEIAGDVIGRATRHLAAHGGPDRHQVLAYDVAHSAAQVAAARAMLDYGAKGDLEARLTCAFTADMIHDLITRLCGRETMWGLDKAPLRETHAFLDKFRSTAFVASFAEQPGPRHLDSEFEMVQDTFRSFADNEIAPRAEHIHRHNDDVPEDLITGLA
ncbi:MAG: acyl-CoA dehydrogenase family protein, partial [Ilumatobacteraceae bacterium]